MAAGRKPGSQCAHNNPVAIDDGTMCLAQSPTPGPMGASSVPVAGGMAKLVRQMTHMEKMEEAIRRAHRKSQISDEVLAQLPSVKQLVISIAIAAGVLTALGIAAGAVASTGVGAVLEVIAAGIVAALAALGIVASVSQVVAGIKMLAKFFEATRHAQTPEDLDTAGKDFATGLAEVGVGTVMLILSVLCARQGVKMGKGALQQSNVRNSGSVAEQVPNAPPRVQPKFESTRMNARYVGEDRPDNDIWGTAVKYLSDSERAAYKLEFRDGKIYDSTGRLFDTGDAATAHSGRGRAIFVMDEDGSFYASKVQQVGEFHHSSLAAGKPVAAAGEISVENGVLRVISDKSGHYTPNRAFTQQALESLQRNGVDTTRVQRDLIGR